MIGRILRPRGGLGSGRAVGAFGPGTSAPAALVRLPGEAADEAPQLPPAGGCGGFCVGEEDDDTCPAEGAAVDLDGTPGGDGDPTDDVQAETGGAPAAGSAPNRPVGPVDARAGVVDPYGHVPVPTGDRHLKRRSLRGV